MVQNCYEDARRAAAYAKLEFPGTYYLAYRDLPDILRAHARGRRALDFGCGAGRSTRFLKHHGHDAVGVDIAADMLAQARVLDPGGDYRLVGEGTLGEGTPGEGTLGEGAGDGYDLILSVFTFDNIPTRERKVLTLVDLRGRLANGGCLVNLVSAPEIYRHEWASFSTRDFPENLDARSGDRVRIVITDSEDPRPVEDVVWSDASYRDVYAAAGLDLVATYRPLGREDEPYRWVNETEIAPWVIYVLRREPPAPRRGEA
jgi:SAM-dependent methyltransferase